MLPAEHLSLAVYIQTYKMGELDVVTTLCCSVLDYDSVLVDSQLWKAAYFFARRVNITYHPDVGLDYPPRRSRVPLKTGYVRTVCTEI